jgi:hypothetical protein
MPKPTAATEVQFELGGEVRRVKSYGELVTAITEGAEQPEATTIRQQFVNIAGMVFDWRDTVAIDVEKFATNTAKTQAYGIRVHDDLKAVFILANVEWAARQSWGTEISVAH